MASNRRSTRSRYVGTSTWARLAASLMSPANVPPGSCRARFATRKSVTNESRKKNVTRLMASRQGLTDRARCPSRNSAVSCPGWKTSATAECRIRSHCRRNGTRGCVRSAQWTPGRNPRTTRRCFGRRNWGNSQLPRRSDMNSWAGRSTVRVDAETPLRAYRNGARRCCRASGRNPSTYARVGCQNADSSSNAAPMAKAVIAKLRLTTPNCFNSALNANRT